MKVIIYRKNDGAIAIGKIPSSDLRIEVVITAPNKAAILFDLNREQVQELKDYLNNL
jgi:hypothetical protein